MVQVYYSMSFKDYKKHASSLSNCVGHSMDTILTDESKITLKVTGEDHVHLYLEKNGFLPLSKGHADIELVSKHHPIMKDRSS